MLTADIRHHITTDFVVYREFGLLCGSNIQAATLLSGLFWWSDVADKEPKRQGWIYKTATQLFDEFGLTRRGYEKARKFLLGKGVIQCRRAGVHGRMHWQLNKERLLELCYLVKGEAVPQFDSRYHIDTDNFRLEKWINLTLWNDFLKMRAEKGKPVNLKQKKILLNQLKDLKNKNYDLEAAMRKAILNGWAGCWHRHAQTLLRQLFLRPLKPERSSERWFCLFFGAKWDIPVCLSVLLSCFYTN